MNGVSGDEGGFVKIARKLNKITIWLREQAFFLVGIFGFLLVGIIGICLVDQEINFGLADIVISIQTNPILYFLGGIGIVCIFVAIIGLHGDQTRLVLTNKDIQQQRIDQEKKIGELQKKNRVMDEVVSDLSIQLFRVRQEKLKYYLGNWFKELGLDEKTRISLYYVDKGSNKLVLLARYAKNVQLAQQGRLQFAFEEGIIGKALQEGNWVDSRIPDFERDPEAYCRYLLEAYQLPEDVSLGFRMKSVALAGYCISDEKQALGVVLFESLDREAFAVKQLEFIVARERAILGRLMKDVVSQGDFRSVDNSIFREKPLETARRSSRTLAKTQLKSARPVLAATPSSNGKKRKNRRSRRDHEKSV